mmetsp:Transcript_16759/g.47810  ORF Transcript_16759/g.47810 Transcript_16759/m.47810 type:complete len:305 (-) Transcript_16759:343-1257(-)
MSARAGDQVLVGATEVQVDWPEGWDAAVAERAQRLAADAKVSGPPLRPTPPPVTAVLLLHQRMGRKEDLDAFARRVTEAGMMAVRWDAPNHGARLIDESANSHWLQGNLANATDMYAQMTSTLREIQVVLDFLPAKLAVDFAKVAVVGFSQGGHAALLAFTNEPRIDVCVSALSAGDYLLNMTKRFEYFNAIAARKGMDRLPPFGALFPDALNRVVTRLDPVHNTERLADGARPLLLLNGGADKLVPVECNAGLVRKLEPLYQSADAAEALRHIIYNGVRHEVTPEIEADSLAWLARWAPPARL